MALREPYAAQGDLLLGDMPLSAAIDPLRFLSDSADEIDVRLSRIYVVPIVGDLTAAATTTLRIANARLASGRILMAQAQAAQDDSLNAYAAYLIREAETTIEAMETNRLPLEGAVARSDLVDTPAPVIRNQDAESAVEAFYGRFMGGGGGSPLPSNPVWRPGA